VTGPRRAACALALALAGTLLAPASARAQQVITGPGDAGPDPHRFRSPQRFAFELKFGPYKPNVDAEFEGSGRTPTPYESFFGPSRHLMSRIEFEWQFFRKLGSLGVSGGVGFFQVTGSALDGMGTGQPTGDTSRFRIIPFSLSGVYRFDYFLETRDFPLVPYGKLGLDYAYWSITDGNGEIAHDGTGAEGQGGTMGWHGTVGAALVLDWFDPDAARSFDADMGVNHTAIAFEYTHADISGLGAANRLHVGDTTWTLGLLLEF
jgi:hypothetical protein